MLVTEHGETTGTISAGCLEGDVAEHAKIALGRGDPTLVEYDTTSTGEDVLALVVPSDEVLARAADALGGLEPATRGPSRGNGPAEYYAARGAAGTVGVITPMSHTYCASCNRVRLTADGRLRTCLFGEHEVDLRTPLRAGESLAPHVRRALAEKPREHALLQLRTGGLRALSQVGG